MTHEEFNNKFDCAYREVVGKFKDENYLINMLKSNAGTPPSSEELMASMLFISFDTSQKLIRSILEQVLEFSD